MRQCLLKEQNLQADIVAIGHGQTGWHEPDGRNNLRISDKFNQIVARTGIYGCR